MSQTDPVPRIARLRQDIARIDQQIMALVSWRMKVAEEIGECKREAGLPVRDFRTEVEVLERTRRACEASGLDPDVGTAVVQALIEGAVRAQHELAGRRAPAGDRKSVLVAGGCGRMGTWLCQYFSAQGHDVTVFDTAPTAPQGFKRVRGLRRALESAEIVALSTPLGDTARILDTVTEARTDALVFDICSLKAPVLPALQRAVAAGLRVTSLHPLFAPGTVLLCGRVLVVCDCGNADAAREARALFEDTALRIVNTSLEQHDRLMAYVLCLSHALNIAFASTLATSGLSPHELDQVASTTFSRQIQTTREVARENPRLYYEIQHHNPWLADVLHSLETAVREMETAARADHSLPFEACMARNRDWFEGTPPQAT